MEIHHAKCKEVTKNIKHYMYKSASRSAKLLHENT